jgi:tRNA (cytidine/uridine-2'-O-)-methyltransferase
MLHIVLYQPQIPPNTGNIMRLCANTGAALHLVGPIRFDLSEAAVRRAGLDYRDQAVVRVHESWDAVREALGTLAPWYAIDVAGQRSHDEADWGTDAVLVFGRERGGLPDEVLAAFPPDHVLRIPMVAGSRSLNLANAVAIVVYEAWRRTGFAGAAPGQQSRVGAS